MCILYPGQIEEEECTESQGRSSAGDAPTLFSLLFGLFRYFCSESLNSFDAFERYTAQSVATNRRLIESPRGLSKGISTPTQSDVMYYLWYMAQVVQSTSAFIFG